MTGTGWSCPGDGAGSSELELALLSPVCVSGADCRGMFSLWFNKSQIQCALPEQFWF